MLVLELFKITSGNAVTQILVDERFTHPYQANKLGVILSMIASIAAIVFIIAILELATRRFIPQPDPFHFSKRKVNPYLPKAKPANSHLLYGLINHPRHSFVRTRNERNNIGFRGSNYNDNSNYSNVFILGDSLVADHFHPENCCLNKQIEAHCPPNVQVYCAASGGENLVDNLAMLCTRIIQLKIDKLVLIMPINDLLDYNRVFSDYLNLHNDDFKPEHKQAIYFQMFPILTSYSHIARMILLWHYRKNARVKPLIEQDQIVLQVNFQTSRKQRLATPIQDSSIDYGFFHHLSRALLSIIGIAKLVNFKLLICHPPVQWHPSSTRNTILTPFYKGMKERMSEKLAYELFIKQKDHVRTLCANNSVQFMDLQEHIDPFDDTLWLDEHHLDTKGMEIIAREIASKIVKM